MSYYYQSRSNPWDELKRFFQSGNILGRLIIINTTIWLLISIFRVFAFLFGVDDQVFSFYTAEYLALPADFSTLIIRPWTLITYMFLHISFFHILFNMLWLYWFGRIFLQYLTSRQLLAVYIWGGIAGGILYILAYNTFPVFGEILPQAKALGASASVMAIVTAISFYMPNYYIHLLFLGRVRILYLALALFVIDFFMIRSSNAGGHIAHIGGFVYGFIYVYYLRKGRDIGEMIRIPWNSLTKPFLKEKKSRFRAAQGGGRPVTDEQYNKEKQKEQEKIDEILEKISKFGYDKLTKEEKEFLFRSSNKNPER